MLMIDINKVIRDMDLNGNPSDDFRDKSEVHQCWDCDSEGEFYETVDDSELIGDADDNDGDTHTIN